MRDYVSTSRCRMEFLRRQLDDEGAAPCGRCDNCAGTWIGSSVSAEALAGAARELDRPGVEVEPRRMWPTGMPALGVDLKGRIPAGEQCSAGRALGRLSDIGWGNRLRPLLAEDAPDGPVPEDVLKAAVAVLADWARSPGGWAPNAPDASARPVGVVSVPSLTRPHLIGSLARGIAAVGRLPHLGGLVYTGPEGAHAARRSNSAQRLRALSGAFAVPEDLAASLAGAPGPVLLVDDETDSGWTLAVTARLLRRAGATRVLPWCSPRPGLSPCDPTGPRTTGTPTPRRASPPGRASGRTPGTRNRSGAGDRPSAPPPRTARLGASRLHAPGSRSVEPGPAPREHASVRAGRFHDGAERPGRGFEGRRRPARRPLRLPGRGPRPPAPTAGPRPPPSGSSPRAVAASSSRPHLPAVGRQTLNTTSSRPTPGPRDGGGAAAPRTAPPGRSHGPGLARARPRPAVPSPTPARTRGGAADATPAHRPGRPDDAVHGTARHGQPANGPPNLWTTVVHRGRRNGGAGGTV
ncbi:hypothetical protein LUX05_18065 [Streptomyces somaliensis]|nr:hypothetical protein [Streptomyces somaliensis]